MTFLEVHFLGKKEEIEEEEMMAFLEGHFLKGWEWEEIGEKLKTFLGGLDCLMEEILLEMILEVEGAIEEDKLMVFLEGLVAETLLVMTLEVWVDFLR